MAADSHHHAPQLNPLAFPVETDMRFLLLIIGAAGTLAGLGDFAFYTLLLTLRVGDAAAWALSTPLALLFALLVFGLAYWRALRSADRLIAARGLKEFPPPARGPDELRSLQAMSDYAGQLVARLPEVAARRPRLFWNEATADSIAPAGLTFGFRRRQYVSLNQGLHAAFLEAPAGERFKSVLLHELGHIANRDVDRTTFSIELGRTVRQAVLALAVLTEAYLIFHIVRRLLNGTLGEVAGGLGVPVAIALGAATVVVLVEIIRASVLRAREYYADARALQWLGSPAPLIVMLGGAARATPRQSIVGPASHLVQQPAAPGAMLVELFRRHLAPLHPPAEQRAAFLRDQHNLFKIDLLTVFIAALLSGLAINANSIVLQLPLHLGSFITSWGSERLQPGISAAEAQWLATITILLSLLSLALFIVLFGVFFVAPLVGTLGSMVQRAAFVEGLGRQQHPPLGAGQMLLMAAVAGCGIVAGGTITPAAGGLTLRGSDWLLAPVFLIVWALVVALWLAPLRWIARRAFRSYTAPRPPLFRRRCLSALAAVAGAPPLILTVLGQATLTTADAQSLPEGALSLMLALWAAAIPASLAMWGLGALLMRLAGWFSPPRCLHCGQMAPPARPITLHCAACGEPLKAWALMPPPPALPVPPRAEPVYTDAPPPL
ncbi:MAG: M48 family metalloprotease [Chloroflexales bacterium]|nr:M48 family metalloprotease [Chloroflexales bacterium]